MEVIKNECISKLEVVRILQKAYAEGRISAIDDCASVLDDINAIPAADVPVRFSSWQYRTYPIVDYDGVARRCSTGYVCKACGHGEPMMKPYCGGCGATMRGEDNG